MRVRPAKISSFAWDGGRVRRRERERHIARLGRDVADEDGLCVLECVDEGTIISGGLQLADFLDDRIGDGANIRAQPAPRSTNPAKEQLSA